jgi:hypothetical protein
MGYIGGCIYIGSRSCYLHCPLRSFLRRAANKMRRNKGGPKALSRLEIE